MADRDHSGTAPSCASDLSTNSPPALADVASSAPDPMRAAVARWAAAAAHCNIFARGGCQKVQVDVDPVQQGRSPDAQIINYFRQWRDIWIEYDNIDKNKDDDLNVCVLRALKIERLISNICADGIIGLSIKAYLLIYRNEERSNNTDANSAAVNMPSVDDACYLEDAIQRSVLTDVMKFFPEIADIMNQTVPA